jgi:dermatan/chondrotin sulfate uronyl 2-O-sulfotransferase UST
MFPDILIPDPKWLAQDFETCVLRGDRECSFIEEDPRNYRMVHHRQMMFFCGHDDLCM